MLPTNQREDVNMRHISLMLVGVAAAAISVSPASAAMRIIADPGGAVIDYVERFEARASAANLSSSTAPACRPARWRSPSCRAGRFALAVLGFHAAWRRTPNGGRVTSPFATQVMYEAYPANVRKWIARHGGLSERLILLKGRELAAVVPACDAGPATRTHPTMRPIRS
jgi:hypothetical protein